MEMVTCSRCGKRVEGNVAFCHECGAPLKAAPTRPTPPPTYAASPAPQPQPQPRPQPAAAQSAVKTGTGMGWIVFLRVLLWISFAGCVICGIVFGTMAMNYGAVGEGFLAILLGIFVGFLVIAGGMISLNNAENLHTIASNTAKTVDLLQRMQREK